MLALGLIALLLADPIGDMQRDHDARVAASRKQAEDSLKAMREKEAKASSASMQRMLGSIAKQKEAQASEEQAAAGRWYAFQMDEDSVAVAMSAMLCHDGAVRSQAIKEMKAEKKYARAGAGLVNKVKLYALQTKMREADESEVEARKTLRTMKRKPMPCGAKELSEFIDCLDDASTCGSFDLEIRQRLTFPEFWVADES